MKIRGLIAVGILLISSSVGYSIPPFELRDQSGNTVRSSDYADGTAALVYYSSRKSTDRSKEQYEVLKSLLPGGAKIVRIANIQRAPGFIHFLIFMMVKNEQPAYPLLFDTTGVSAGRFQVDDEECGFFLYRDGKEAWSYKARYTNEAFFRAALSNLASAANSTTPAK